MSPWVLQSLLKVCWSCDPHQGRRFNQSFFSWGVFREQSCYTPPGPLSALKVEYLEKHAQHRAPLSGGSVVPTGSTARSSYWPGKMFNCMDQAPAREMFLWSTDSMAPHPFSSPLLRSQIPPAAAGTGKSLQPD